MQYVARRHRVVVPTVVLAFLTLLILLTTMGANAVQGGPTLTTDKPDYAPNEVVHISGPGFVPGDYDVPVKRPDGSIVLGDGSFESGWDTVTADGAGDLSYDYQLNGIFGTYEVRAYPAGWTGDWNEVPVAIVMTAAPGARWALTTPVETG